MSLSENDPGEGHEPNHRNTERKSGAGVRVSAFGVVLVVDTPLKLLGEPAVSRPPDSAHLKLFKDCSVLMALEATLYESVKLIVIQSQ